MFYAFTILFFLLVGSPKIKSAATSGSTVTYNSPQGLFRMDSNELMWDTKAVSVYGISFSCTESD